MSKNRVAAEMDRLREEIRRHEYLYYVQDDPEISDAAFDRLVTGLKQLETEHPTWSRPIPPRSASAVSRERGCSPSGTPRR